MANGGGPWAEEDFYPGWRLRVERMCNGMEAMTYAMLRLLGRKCESEIRLIEAVLAEPVEGLKLAREAGVGIGSFEREDVRLMWAALEAFADRGWEEVVRWMKKLLVFEGYYGTDAAWWERGDRWSDASLANLACAEYSVCFVTRRAREVAELDERIVHVRRLYYKTVVAAKGEDAREIEVEQAMGEEVSGERVRRWAERRKKVRVVVRPVVVRLGRKG
jgi:hypothetical protein